MKLTYCLSLCLVSISAYSLQHLEHAHTRVTTRGQLQSSHNSIIAGQGHNLPNNPSIAALTKFIYGEADLRSRTNPSSNTYENRKSPAPAQTECFDRAVSVLRLTKDSLYRRGLSVEAVDSIMAEVLQNMAAKIASASKFGEGDLQVSGYKPAHAYSKRGYARGGGIRLRFSPRFGTKLVPTEKTGDSGSTLLRYGRSVQRGLKSSRE